jgi:hypothetical protein
MANIQHRFGMDVRWNIQVQRAAHLVRLVLRSPMPGLPFEEWIEEPAHDLDIAPPKAPSRSIAEAPFRLMLSARWRNRA